jgi:hypothetical protein
MTVAGRTVHWHRPENHRAGHYTDRDVQGYTPLARVRVHGYRNTATIINRIRLIESPADYIRESTRNDEEPRL